MPTNFSFGATSMPNASTSQPNPLDALFAAMSQYFQNQPNQLDLFRELKTPRSQNPDLTYMAGRDGAANPFSNGFFKNENMGSGKGAYAPLDPVARASTRASMQFAGVPVHNPGRQIGGPVDPFAFLNPPVLNNPLNYAQVPSELPLGGQYFSTPFGTIGRKFVTPVRPF